MIQFDKDKEFVVLIHRPVEKSVEFLNVGLAHVVTRRISPLSTLYDVGEGNSELLGYVVGDKVFKTDIFIERWAKEPYEDEAFSDDVFETLDRFHTQHKVTNWIGTWNDEDVKNEIESRIKEVFISHQNIIAKIGVDQDQPTHKTFAVLNKNGDLILDSILGEYIRRDDKGGVYIVDKIGETVFYGELKNVSVFVNPTDDDISNNTDTDK